MKALFVFIAISFKIALCRDFYVGMFKENDILVAQDMLYKEKRTFGFATAKYGRIFRCPITYFRITDRLGLGRPPRVKITRGGLRKKYLTLLLTSAYNMPISVNIYVGCANAITTTTEATNTTETDKGGEKKKGDDKKKEAEEEGGGGGDETAAGGADNAVADDNANAADPPKDD